MADIVTSKESGAAGKPGEGTASGQAPAVNGDPKNLAPENIVSLLSSEFAAPAPGATPAARKPGEEVQPGGTAGEDKAKGGAGATKEPEWSEDKKAWFELRAKATTAEEIAAADAQAPEFSEEEKAWIESQDAGDAEGGSREQLPEHLEAELEQWEAKGGTLPASLQKLVEKRIHKIVDERDQHKQRADQAEAEVTRLTGELETASANGGGRPSSGGMMDEKTLTGMVDASKRFQADARAFIGGYADEAATERIQKHLAASGQDDKGLRRQLDEVNDWLTQGAPAMRKQIGEFKATEATLAPVVAERFPSLADKTKPEYQFAQDVLKFIPDLPSRTPAHKFAMGLYALGKVAFEHLNQANPKGDVIAALRGVLTKHAPVAAGGGDKKKFFLPGKKPPGTPTGGSPGGSPRVTRKDAQSEQASAELAKNPTAANAEQLARTALATV